MADQLTPERRSWNMSRIRAGDTGPERIVRSLVHRLGFRFRLASGGALPGRPDIVLARHRTVIFVHGCFWHHHRGCRYAYTPKSRVEFWTGKFIENRARDGRVARRLRRDGWRVLTVWECETRSADRLSSRLRRLLCEPRIG